jgi:hypothetical protein
MNEALSAVLSANSRGALYTVRCQIIFDSWCHKLTPCRPHLGFEVAGEKVVLEGYAVFQGLVPAFDLLLDLGMIRRRAQASCGDRPASARSPNISLEPLSLVSLGLVPESVPTRRSERAYKKPLLRLLACCLPHCPVR